MTKDNIYGWWKTTYDHNKISYRFDKDGKGRYVSSLVDVTFEGCYTSDITYKIEGNTITIQTDAMKTQYTFELRDNQLILSNEKCVLTLSR